MSAVFGLRYSDLHLVTVEGRPIGILLMTARVGLLRTVRGLLASSFLAPDREHEDAELHAVRKELAALGALIEKSLNSRRG